MPDQTEEQIEPDSMHVQVKDHLVTPPEDECGYCSQAFGPDDVVVEREVHGHKWKFCSEECYRDFLDKNDFKDEDRSKSKRNTTISTTSGRNRKKKKTICFLHR